MSDSGKQFTTPQEEFWSGSFGDDYIGRNTEEGFLASNTALFAKILSRTHGIKSVMEFGSNIGLNLRAIKTLLPNASQTAIEINAMACKKLQEKLPKTKILNESILNIEIEQKVDLALIKGVLIHINPDALQTVYQKLAQAATRYVLIAEYYNPSPVTINYRGHEDRLFKRDFAGEFMDYQRHFQLVDYGFVWHKDPNFPQDDTTWFLMERTK